ncbi:MAG: hypothetical protein ACK4J0_00435 [Candidatus Anstonellaceae archaeon]
MLKVIVDGKEVKLPKKFERITDMLQYLQISKQIAIIKVNGKICPPENPMPKKGKIQIMRVVFGG